MTKECGECQMCCVMFNIPDTDSLPDQKCKHQCESGCAIYTIRPKPCRDYECLWLVDDNIPDEFRPDKLGCIVDIHHSTIGPAIICKQAYDNQYKEKPIADYLTELSRRTGYWIHVICGSKTEAVFPPWCKTQEEQFNQRIKDGLEGLIMGRMY